MKTCPVCSNTNPEDADLCTHCASPLTQMCHHCGGLIALDSKFCSHCGTSLKVHKVCAHCNQPLLPNSKFCNQCGHPIEPTDTEDDAATGDLTPQNSPFQKPSTADWAVSAATEEPLSAAVRNGNAGRDSLILSELQGERREVSVLFLDLLDFTRMSSQIDSEEIYLIVDEAMRLLVQIIYRYEGTVDKFTGDGLMALFGTPTAHENDPERAVRAGLEMQHVLKPLQQRIQDLYGFNFQARIGINTGIVIAGNLGNDLHMEYTVIGDTVNLAARLETAAEPGTILVSYDTYQRTRPIFRFQPMPPVELKGYSEPVPAYRPLAVRKYPGSVRGLPGVQSPMIGRTDELTSLHKAWEHVQHQKCNQIVLVTGEAGLGKSRLVSEFRRDIDSTTNNIYEGNCLAFARSKPFWVFASLLRDILQISELDTPDHQRDSLKLFIDHLNLPQHQMLPYLISVLGLELSDEQINERLQQLDPGMLQRQTYVAVRQLLLAMSQLAPLSIIFDDLHWVDPASKELLIYLIQSISDAPILLILVSRNFERKTTIRPLLDTLERSALRFTDVELGRLGDNEAIELLAQLLKHNGDDGSMRQLQQRIVQRAEGNPFYIEEIVRMLIDQHILVKQNNRFEIAANTDETLAQFPATLKSLILTRFDGLSEELRQILQKAAVLGRSFPLSLLQSLHHTEPEQIVAHLYDLKNRLFLTEDPFNHEPGFTFYHALIQEAIYSTMLNRDRKTVHGQVAHAIERGYFYNDDERAEALGYHYSHSNEMARAIPYLITAAENASRRSAHETGVEHYRHALKLMADQPNPDGEEFIRLRIGLGHTLKLKGEFNEASQRLTEAIEWLSNLGTEQAEQSVNLIEGLRELADVRQREGALDEAFDHLETALSLCDRIEGEQHPYLWYALIDRMAWVRFRLGQLDEAEQLATQAVRNLEKQEAAAPALLASLYNTLGGTHYQQGSPSEAIPFVEKSLQLHDVLGYTWGKAVAHINLGVLYYVQGLWSSAIENYSQADRIEQENGFVAERAVNLRNLGLLHIGRGDHEQARQDYETSLAISRHIGDSTGIGCCHIGLAHLNFILSDLEQAAAHIQAAQEEADALGEDHFMQLLLIQARIHAQTGAIHAGFELASQVLQMAQASGLSEEEVEAYRVLGRLHTRSNEYMKAESQLRQSLEAARQRRNPYQEGQALLEMGLLYQAQLKSRQWHRAELVNKAEQVLGDAIEAFERLGAKHDLQIAQRLRQDLREASLPATVPTITANSSIRYRAPLSGGHESGSEKHTVSVVWIQLLAHMMGETNQAEGKDDHALEAIREVTAEVSAVTTALEGKMFHQPGAICIVFGINGAHIDDPERAMRAAWHLRKTFAQRKESRSLKLQYAVTMGDIPPGRFATSGTGDVGDPVQEAAGLAQQSPPHRLWVTQPVRVATQHLFVFQGTTSTAYVEAVNVQDLPGFHHQLADASAAFIGRAALLDSMIQLAQHLPHNEGGIIWLEGDAGMGTSRLMHEFAARMRFEDASLWRASCSAQTASTPLSLFNSLLTHAFALSASDTVEEKRAKIEEGMRRLTKGAQTDATQALHSYIELICNVRSGEKSSSQHINLEPQELRQQIFVNMRILFNLVSKSGPLILLLDDLHWIDPMSAELLLFLSNLVVSAPVLFICTQRRQSEQLPAVLKRIQSLYPVYNLHVHVKPLNRAESQALISDLLKQTTLTDEARETILVRGEGNPYFLKELVRTALEHKRVDDLLQAEETGKEAESAALLIPTSLATLLQERLNDLSPALKKVLQYMSVLGRPASTSLLATLTQQPNIEILLQQVARKGLLTYVGDTDLWQFSHWLVEKLVYDALLKIQQQIFHREIAEALEEMWAEAESEHADELAYHFHMGNEPQKSIVYHVKAAEYAARLYANEEALAHYKQADAALANVLVVEDEMRWQIAVGLSDVHQALGLYTEAARNIESVLSLHTVEGERRAGTLRRLGQVYQKQGKAEQALSSFAKALALLDDQKHPAAKLERSRIYISRAWTYFFEGNCTQAHEDCRLSLEHAREINNLSEQAAAESLLGGIYHTMGDWTLAIEHTTNAMELRKQIGYSWGVAAIMSNLGTLSIFAGQWKEAERYFAESLGQRSEMGDAEGISSCHINLGKLACEMGELTESEFHYRVGLKIADHVNATYLATSARIGLARVNLMRNNPGDAQELIKICLLEAESIQAEELLVEARVVQSEILLTQSLTNQAEQLASQAALTAASIGIAGIEASAWRVVCEAQVTQHSRAAVETLQKGQHILSGVSDPLGKARWIVLAGKVSCLDGRHCDAKAQFIQAQELFTQLGAQHDLRGVNSLLQGLV